jgi:hypothetical protein
MARDYFAVVEAILDGSRSVSAKAYGLCLGRLDADVRDLDRRLALGGRVKLLQRAQHVINQFLLSFAGKQFAVVEAAVAGTPPPSHPQPPWPLTRAWRSTEQLAQLPARIKAVLEDKPLPASIPAVGAGLAPARPRSASSSSTSSPVVTDAPPTPTPLSRGEALLAAGQDVVLTIVHGMDAAAAELEAVVQLEDAFVQAHLPAFALASLREAAQLWTKLAATLAVGSAHLPPQRPDPVPYWMLPAFGRRVIGCWRAAAPQPRGGARADPPLFQGLPRARGDRHSVRRHACPIHSPRVTQAETHAGLCGSLSLSLSLSLAGTHTVVWPKWSARWYGGRRWPTT